jgi:hypothetical protein
MPGYQTKKKHKTIEISKPSTKKTKHRQTNKSEEEENTIGYGNICHKREGGARE